MGVYTGRAMKLSLKLAALAPIICASACGGNHSADPVSPGAQLSREYSATLPGGGNAVLTFERSSGAGWSGSMDFFGADDEFGEEFDGTHEGNTFHGTGEKEDGSTFTVTATRLPNGHLSVVHSDLGQAIDFEPLEVNTASMGRRVPSSFALKFSHDAAYRILTVEAAPYERSSTIEKYRGRMSGHDVAIYTSISSGGGAFYFYLGEFGQKPYMHVDPNTKLTNLANGWAASGYIASEDVIAGTLSFRFGKP